MSHFSLLLYLLVATFVCSFFNALLFSQTRQKTRFDRVLIWVNAYLGVHASYVFLVRAVFYDYLYLDRLAPFALLYGPFCFMVFASLLKGRISGRTILIHTFAPIFFWLSFFALLAIGVDSSARKLYGYALTIAVPLSLLGYTSYGLYCNTLLHGKLKRYKLMVIPALLLMLFMCAICIIVPFYRVQLSTSVQARELLSIMVYTLMFLASLLILKYCLFVFKKRKRKIFIVTQEYSPYQRSALSKMQLEDYRFKLEQLMDSEKTFLIAGLSLASLSKILRIPEHQLTQVFTFSIGNTFSQYVNTRRIQYACDLLQNSPEIKVAEIATKSGFSTLVSFYRQFKSVMGVTPAEYRKKSTS